MTLFVILGLVAVVIGVLVAVVLGVRTMRAQERAGDDWESPEPDSEYGDPDDQGEPVRRRGDRGRQGARRSPDRTGRDGYDDYDARRGHRGRSGGARSRRDNADYGSDHDYETDPGAGTDPGPGREYQRANGRPARTSRGAEPDYGGGYQRRPAAAAARGGNFPQMRDQESMLGAAEIAARAAGRPVAGDGTEPHVTAQAGRRHTPQKEQPKKRARPPKGRGESPEGWNGTNWDRVSDEDYWAELSADKPLASRTAQSAADLRSPDPEPVMKKKKRDAHTDPNLAQPEPQTATMAMPEFSAGGTLAAGQAEREIPALPVRRSGSTPAHGFAVPATTRPAVNATAEYTDPNLALLASLGEPAADGRPLAAGNGRSAAAEPPVTPPGGWPGGGPAQGDWSRGPDVAAAARNTGGYQSAPPAASAQPGMYGNPSYGMEQQASGYAANTPGLGIPASPSYAAGNPFDTGPNTPAPNTPAPNTPARPAAAPYGPAYGAGPDQNTGQFGGHADLTSPSGSAYSGSHAAGAYGNSYDTGSYRTSDTGSYGTMDTGSYGAADTGSYGTTGPPSYGGAPATGSHTPAAYGTGSYPAAYGAAGGQPANDAGWGSPGAPLGRPADGSGSAALGGPAGIGGPAPMGGYDVPIPNGYAGAIPASPPGTPAAGIPRVTGGNPANGYSGAPPAGGFASGYLSSSALSARQGRSEPGPITSSSSANPYGSYVTDPPSTAESANGNRPRRHARPSDTNGYDEQRSYGGYRDYGGGSRH